MPRGFDRNLQPKDLPDLIPIFHAAWKEEVISMQKMPGLSASLITALAFIYFKLRV